MKIIFQKQSWRQGAEVFTYMAHGTGTMFFGITNTKEFLIYWGKFRNYNTFTKTGNILPIYGKVGIKI